MDDAADIVKTLEQIGAIKSHQFCSNAVETIKETQLGVGEKYRAKISSFASRMIASSAKDYKSTINHLITQQLAVVSKSLMGHYQHQLANPIIQEGMQQISLSDKISDTLLGDSYRLNDAIRDIQSRNSYKVINLDGSKGVAIAAGDNGTIMMHGQNKSSNSEPALKLDPHNTNVQHGLTIGQAQKLDKRLFGTGEKLAQGASRQLGAVDSIGNGHHPELVSGYRPITAADIGFAGLTSVDIALLLTQPKSLLPVSISQKTAEYLNSVALQSGWHTALSSDSSIQPVKLYNVNSSIVGTSQQDSSLFISSAHASSATGVLGGASALRELIPGFELLAVTSSKYVFPYERYASMLGLHHDAATTITDTSSTADNSTTAHNTEVPTTSTAWTSGICKVPKEDMGVLRSAYCKGEAYVVEKYQHARQLIAQKVEETPKTALARIQELALTSLKNPNVTATYVEAAGQVMLYTVDHSNQLTAKHLPQTRAIINTAAEIGKDALLTTGAKIWQQLPEATKPIIRRTIVDAGTEIGVVYELLTGNLSEGQKAIADLAIGVATSKVAGSALTAARLAAQQGKILFLGLKKIEGGIITKIPTPPKPGDILGASTFTLPDGKVIISYDVFGGGKPKIPKSLPGGIIPIETTPAAVNYALKKVEQRSILLPELEHVLQNLPEGTPKMNLIKGTKGKIAIKFDDATRSHTQIHHAIPQNLKAHKAIQYAELDIIKDEKNLMTLYTPKGAELATQRYNGIKTAYSKYLQELNPSITEQEIDAIVKWKVPLSNRPTHQGRHHKDYSKDIRIKLDTLWEKVEEKIGRNEFTKEECREEIYNLMSALKKSIQDDSIKLYNRKK